MTKQKNDLRDKDIDELLKAALKQMEEDADKPIEYPTEDRYVMLNPNVYANLIHRAFETEREKKELIESFVKEIRKSIFDYYEIAVEESSVWDDSEKDLISSAFATVDKLLYSTAQRFIKEKKL